MIRSNQGVGQFAMPVQRIVSEMDDDLPLSDVLTTDQLLGKSTLDAGFNTTLLVAFAVTPCGNSLLEGQPFGKPHRLISRSQKSWCN